MTKETGMMFKGPLVLAILEGRKTQTRRVMKPQLEQCDWFPSWYLPTGPEEGIFWPNGKNKILALSPYGQPGDLIYVRETHAQHPQFPQMAFRADGEEFEDADGFLWLPKWTPAIHMKKEEARIWLEITGVRIERLQDISTEDCIAEGLSTTMREHDAEAHLRQQFQELWESTGANWADNPWVWVIDFKPYRYTQRLNAAA